MMSRRTRRLDQLLFAQIAMESALDLWERAGGFAPCCEVCDAFFETPEAYIAHWARTHGESEVYGRTVFVALCRSVARRQQCRTARRDGSYSKGKVRCEV